jgi:hypothetical protein
VTHVTRGPGWRDVFRVKVETQQSTLTSGKLFKMMDFRSHVVRRDFENCKGDRQLEAPRAGAAGINIKDPVDPLDLRHVRMAGNDYVEASASIDVKRLEIVQNVDRLRRKVHDFGVDVFPSPITGAILRSASTISGRPMSPACTM